MFDPQAREIIQSLVALPVEVAAYHFEAGPKVFQQFHSKNYPKLDGWFPCVYHLTGKYVCVALSNIVNGENYIINRPGYIYNVSGEKVSDEIKAKLAEVAKTFASLPTCSLAVPDPLKMENPEELTVCMVEVV